MRSPICSRSTSRDGLPPSTSSLPTPRSPPLKSALKHHSGSPPTLAPTSGIHSNSPLSSVPMSSEGSGSRITFAQKTRGDPLPEISQLSLDNPSATTTLTGTSGSSPRTSMSSAQRPPMTHRRSSSEMPEGYERRVGFSTLDLDEGTKGGGIGAEFSFTVQAKSEGYASTEESRCFLVASDGASYSVSALDWLVANLVEDGDEIIVLRVIEPGSAAHNEFAHDHEVATRLEAEEVLLYVLEKNDRKITVSVEFVIGPIIKTIQRCAGPDSTTYGWLTPCSSTTRMLEVYRPDSLVVGTRGRTGSAWKQAFLGSTSQYLVAKSPVVRTFAAVPAFQKLIACTAGHRRST